MIKQRSKKNRIQIPIWLVGIAFGFLIAIVATLKIIQHVGRAELNNNLATRQQDITYCNGEKLDLFVPKSAKPLPLIIYIHGGGWQFGSKEGDTFHFVKPLVKEGFAVASINYRLSSVEPFPAQVQDVHCAIRYLRSQTARYNIDGSKIGLIGISAGAHLAVLAANASDEAKFSAGPYQTQPSRVSAVVAMSGIYNLQSTDTNKFTTQTSENIQKLLMNSPNSRVEASPISYLSKDDPSQLLIYGTKDSLVSPTQTINYAQNAKLAGIKTQAIAVKNANHILQPNILLLQPTQPSQKELFNQIVSFLLTNL